MNLAMSNTVRWLADCHTFWAIVEFTSFVWAHDVAVWLFALNVADGVLWLLARSVTFRWLANWVANGVTLGVVAFPGAFWVAFLS